MLVDVTADEDDEVEARGVGPVQVLEHEQDRRCGGALGEQRERLFEHLQLRARSPAIWWAELAERTQRFDERLVRQLRADEIDRAPEQDLEPRAAGPIPELGHEAGLADPGVPGKQDGRPASLPGRCERALQLSELTRTPEECCVPATHHRRQYCAAPPKIRSRRAKDKALRPMRRQPSTTTISRKRQARRRRDRWRQSRKTSAGGRRSTPFGAAAGCGCTCASGAIQTAHRSCSSTAGRRTTSAG